ncbi:unnamed protein product [Meloidogyne enterolobii]|uniref:Uncharacterized protein n=1 Tax=Meloidogyne enterolobii TaxID=390850 RepID=A0ACB0YEB0_MELEN
MPKRVKEETLTIRDTQDIQKIKPEHVEGKGKEIARKCRQIIFLCCKERIGLFSLAETSHFRN